MCRWIVVREVQQPIPLLFHLSLEVSKNLVHDPETPKTSDSLSLFAYRVDSFSESFRSMRMIRNACRGFRSLAEIGV